MKVSSFTCGHPYSALYTAFRSLNVSHDLLPKTISATFAALSVYFFTTKPNFK